MQLETYRNICSQTNTLRKTLQKIVVVWEHPSYEILETLLQNFSGSIEHCQGFDLGEEFQKLIGIKEAVKAIYTYENCAVHKFVWEQFDMIITGNLYSEDEP